MTALIAACACTSTTCVPIAATPEWLFAMLRLVEDEVAIAVRERWAAELDRIGVDSTWVGELLRPVLAAACEDPELRRLFPFQSMNRLCFSRCSEYPYTLDCPCISAHRGGYAVLATWAVSDDPAPVLADTEDPAEAASIVARHLPTDRRVWIGSADQRS